MVVDFAEVVAEHVAEQIVDHVVDYVEHFVVDVADDFVDNFAADYSVLPRQIMLTLIFFLVANTVKMNIFFFKIQFRIHLNQFGFFQFFFYKPKSEQMHLAQ